MTCSTVLSSTRYCFTDASRSEGSAGPCFNTITDGCPARTPARISDCVATKRVKIDLQLKSQGTYNIPTTDKDIHTHTPTHPQEETTPQAGEGPSGSKFRKVRALVYLLYKVIK